MATDSAEDHAADPWAISDQNRFRLYYRTNFWGDSETTSGDSSRLDRARIALTLLQRLVDSAPRLRIFDVGCGDVNWIQFLRLREGSSYVGLDIVPELVERNRNLISDPGFSFLQGDARYDTLPEADVVVIRDVLVHLSTPDAHVVLSNVRSLAPRILLATTYRESRRSWPEDHSFRPVDLEQPSYALGPADVFLPEAPDYDRSSDGIKGLGVWMLGTCSPAEIEALSARDAQSLVAPTKPQMIVSSSWGQDPSPILWRESGGLGRRDAGPKGVYVDGRGYAFLAPQPEASAEQEVGWDPVSPRLVLLTATERRLTKSRSLEYPPGWTRMVIGARAIVQARGQVADEYYLTVPGSSSRSQSGHLVSPGLVGAHGYLRRSAAVPPGRLLAVPDSSPLERLLLAYPLSGVLSLTPLFHELEADGGVRRACIWGAGTVGLLAAQVLKARGWIVEVAAPITTAGGAASLAAEIGVAFRAEAFDFVPHEPPLLSMVCSGDPRTITAALHSTQLAGVVVMWPELGEREYASRLSSEICEHSRIVVPGPPLPETMSAAVEVLSESWDDWYDRLLPRAVDLESFESALFPRVPTRLGLIAL